MYANFVGRLSRRDGPDFNPGDDFKKVFEELSPLGIAVLVLTVFFGTIVIYTIQYTIGHVVPTLAMIESPVAGMLVQNDDPDSKPSDGLLEDPEIILVQTKPVTAKIRTTLRHLTARAGYWARWRGLATAFCYRLALGILITPFMSLYSPGVHLYKALGMILLARWSMCWTHIVMTEPSPRPWYQRLLPLRSWKKIWAPTAVYALASLLVEILPAIVAFILFSQEAEPVEEIPVNINVITALKGCTVLLIALVTFVGIKIPATVALTRCQASLLAHDEQPIVPFDRTFGGRIVPEELGGTGRIGYWDAWRSFEPAARLRLLKLYVKYFAIQVAFGVLFIGVLAAELFVFTGGDAQKIIKDPASLMMNVQSYTQQMSL